MAKVTKAKGSFGGFKFGKKSAKVGGSKKIFGGPMDMMGDRKMSSGMRKMHGGGGRHM